MSTVMAKPAPKTEEVVRRKLLGLDMCPRCNREVPYDEVNDENFPNAKLSCYTCNKEADLDINSILKKRMATRSRK